MFGILCFATALSAQDEKLRVPDLKGRSTDPFEAPAAKAVVFLFIAVDCPISNRYAPEIRRLCESYSKKGVRFWLVHVDPNLSVRKAASHRSDYKLPDRILMDRKHDLVKLCRAKITPEAAVFDGKRRLVYRGRIDNLYVEFGRTRRRTTQHDLRDALDAVLEGKPVAVPRQRAIGCYISGSPR